MPSRFLIFCFFFSCIALSRMLIFLLIIIDVECKHLLGKFIREVDEDDNTGTDEGFEETEEDFTDKNDEDDNTVEEEATTEEDEITNIVRDSDDLINCITNEEPTCIFEDDIELIGWIPLKVNGTVIQGNGHIILLDSFNKSDAGFVGIFSKMTNVEIYDLKIEIVNHFEYTIKEGETFGFLAGEISDNAIIEKVSIIPQNITINSTTQSMVGLLAGSIINSNSNNNNEIVIDRFSIPNYNNKYNKLVFNGKYSQIGLFVSESENIKIINSYVSLNNIIINTESQSNNILFAMMMTICSNCEIINSYSRLNNLEIKSKDVNNNNVVDFDITGFIGKSEDNRIINSFIIFPKIYFDENMIKSSTSSLHAKNNIAGFLLDNRNTEMIGCYVIITLDTILYNNNNNIPSVDFSGFTMIENGNSTYSNCYLQIRGYTDVEFNSKNVFIKTILSENEESVTVLNECLMELYNNENEWKFIYSDDINDNNNNNNSNRMLITDLTKIEIENNTYIYGNINIDIYENITKLTTKDYESENILFLSTSSIDGYWSYYTDPVTGDKKLRLFRLIFPIWHNGNDEFIFSEPTVSHSVVEDSWDMNIWSIDSNGQIFNNGNMKFEIKKKTLFYKHKELCPNFCSNHGTCGNRGKCICYQGYTGIDCSLRVCPSSVVIDKNIDSSTYPTECSSHGVCNRQTGKCECEKGYEGYACHRINCPNDCRDVRGRCLRYETLKSYEKDQVRQEYIEKYGHWDVYQEYVCLPNSL